MKQEKLLFDQKYPKISFIFDVLFKSLILSFLFMIGLVIGLILFGFGPSFVASKRLSNDWLNKEHPPVFKTFFFYYKSSFVLHHVINLIYLGIIGLILFNFYFFYMNLESSIIRMIGLMLNVIFFTFVWSSWHTLFQLKYGFELSWKEAFTFSFRYIWGFPSAMFLMLFIHVMSLLASYLIPHIFIFFSLGWIILSSNLLMVAIKEKFQLDEEI